MTPLKEITGISLEKAKELKAAGFPQDIPDAYGDEQSKWWCQYEGQEPRELWCQSDEFNDDGTHGEEHECKVLYKSPSAEEILQKLPKEITIGRTKYILQIFWYTEDGCPCVRYVSDIGTDFWDEYPEYGVTRETLTEALSDMYIYLSQHNLL